MLKKMTFKLLDTYKSIRKKSKQLKKKSNYSSIDFMTQFYKKDTLLNNGRYKILR